MLFTRNNKGAFILIDSHDEWNLTELFLSNHFVRMAGKEWKLPFGVDSWTETVWEF